MRRFMGGRTHGGAARALACAAALALAACGEPERGEQMEFRMDPTLKEDLAKVARYRVFFGHQSVGGNIVEGLRDLSRLAGVDSLNILEPKPGDSLPASFFAHATVGENRDVESKLVGFSRRVEGDLSRRLDVALIKFCYVDIHRDSPVEDYFRAYLDTLNRLKRDHPDVVFVPVTTALMVKEGWNKYKYLVKSLLGVENDNVKRNRFNELMRQAFRDGPLFDLAAVESTLPDGSRETFGDGQPALAHAYTHDGGHLNELGRRVAAQALVKTLARIEPGAARSARVKE